MSTIISKKHKAEADGNEFLFGTDHRIRLLLEKTADAGGKEKEPSSKILTLF